MDGGSACVGIGACECERGGAIFDQGTASAHDGGIGSVGGLVEEDAGVVLDISLETGCGAGEGSGIDGGSTGVGIDAGKCCCSIAVFS